MKENTGRQRTDGAGAAREKPVGKAGAAHGEDSGKAGAECWKSPGNVREMHERYMGDAGDACQPRPSPFDTRNSVLKASPESPERIKTCLLCHCIIKLPTPNPESR